MKRLFLGKPLHWLLWLIVLVVLYSLGSSSFHVRYFNAFSMILLALSTVCVLIILFTYRRGERITRDPFDEA